MSLIRLGRVLQCLRAYKARRKRQGALRGTIVDAAGGVLRVPFEPRWSTKSLVILAYVFGETTVTTTPWELTPATLVAQRV